MRPTLLAATTTVALLLPLTAQAAKETRETRETPGTTAKETATRTGGSAAVLAPDRLRPFLPEPPEGWKAGRVESQKSEDDEIHLSSVRRSYYKGDSEDAPVAAVTIIDSANNANFFDSDEEAKWEDESETDEGYDKRLLVDGMRVIEHYNREARTGSLSIFVGNRYFVQIELTNEAPKELYSWLKRINTAGLAALR